MFRKSSSLRSLMLTASVSAIAITSGASAIQDDEDDGFSLEEIVVTAQKRQQSLQEVALSVNVVSNEKLETRGINDFDSLSNYVPNFQVSEGITGSFMSVRGISSGSNPGFEQSVVIYNDEIALSRAPLIRAPFMDLARAEIVRGPQNVLNGKNSIGGAINLTTARPTEEFEGSVKLAYHPEEDGKILQAILSGPLSERLRARVALRYYEEDGWMYNEIQNRKEAQRQEFTGRITLEYDVTENLLASLKYERNDWDKKGRTDEIMYSFAARGGPFAGLDFATVNGIMAGLTGIDYGSDSNVPGDDIRATDYREFAENSSDLATLKLVYDNENYTITSTTGWVQSDTADHIDGDGVGFDIFGEGLQHETYEQFSSDFRISSPGGEKVDWIIGAFYQDWDMTFHSSNRFDNSSIFPALAGTTPILGFLTDFTQTRDSSSTSKTKALYGQAIINLNDRFRLNLGARYTKETRETNRMIELLDNQGNFDLFKALAGALVFQFDYKSLGEFSANNVIPFIPGAPFPAGHFAIHDIYGKRKESAFTPSVVLEADISDNAMVYASWSKGVKAGGHDQRGVKVQDFDFEEERVQNFEAGLKTSFADGRGELNIAGYYMDYTDLQVSQYTGTVGFNVGNADAENKGIEVEGRYLITEDLLMTFSGAWLDFEFKDYQNAQCNITEARATGAALCDYEGKTNVFSPKFTAAIALDHTARLNDKFELRTTLDINHRGSHFVNYSLEPEIKQDAATYMNARMALETENWSLAAVGKNLTNVRRYTFGLDLALSGSFDTPTFLGNTNRPRSWGLEFVYKF